MAHVVTLYSTPAAADLGQASVLLSAVCAHMLSRCTALLNHAVRTLFDPHHVGRNHGCRPVVTPVDWDEPVLDESVDLSACVGMALLSLEADRLG